jgi:NAD(P)H-hydrate epimerase
MFEHALLSVAEMARADAAAIAGGMPGLALMENAGGAIAREVRRRWPKQPVAVLCGPGNNGGDGFVAARLLKEQGWPVRLAFLGTRSDLKGDAATNAERWTDAIASLDVTVLDGCALVIDALFGAGLARPIAGSAVATIEAINQRRLACVAVDIPSGVHGDTGSVLGIAPQARVTVTFFRRKPGHVLYPGRDLCGDVIVADIGIPATVLADIAPKTFANAPALWGHRWPWPTPLANKYSRGHAVIVGGSEMTGAARLAAQGARRIGAGLVTIAAPESVFAIYAAGPPGALVKPLPSGAAGDRAFAAYLADIRRNAVLVGPGAGVTPLTKRRALAALKARKAVVLDADALSVFAKEPNALFKAIGSPCVMTPHEGEFRRLFKGGGDRLSRARAAARKAGAVILFKGPDTVVAAPDGRAVINENATPDLATAGSGDVLAGMVMGLLAQGMDPFEAACAAVWVHGAAADGFGSGVLAEDLPEQMPTILRQLKAAREP